MMLKKTLMTATAVACGLFALTSGAVAADPKAPTPVPYGQTVEATPSVSMGDAVAKSEKAYDARSTSARLRSAHGELFWAVRLEKADGERLVAFVDAKTGEITAARTLGKRGEAASHHYRYDCPMGNDGRYCRGNDDRRGNCMTGYRGHHRGPGCGGC